MENEKELNRLTEKAAKVKGMVEHPGWKEVIRPSIMVMCDGWLNNFRSAKTVEDLQTAQFGLLAAEFLLSIPDVVIADGADANDKLEILKKK